MRVVGKPTKERSRMVSKESTQYGIINFDEDNAYPQRSSALTKASPTAKICLDTYARFIFGGGFKDAEFYKAIVNSDGQTNDKILDLIVKDLAEHRGCSVHCNVSLGGKITEIHHVPFEYVRKASDKKKEETGFDFAIYNDWGKDRSSNIKSADVDWVHKFSLNVDDIKEQVGDGGIDQYKGQLFYFSFDEGSYPLSSSDAVSEMMYAEIQSDIKTTSNIENNFSAKAIFVHKGKFTSDEDRADFEDDVDQFIGPEGSDIIVVDIDKEEEIPQIISIPSMSEDDMYQLTDKKVVGKIVRNFLIPKILLSVTDDGGGFFNQEQIRDATMYYNMVTVKERNAVEEIFKTIFEFFETDVNKSGDFSIAPIEFKISKAEPPAGLVDLIKSSDVTQEVKRSMMVILYGVDSEDAKLMAPDVVGQTQEI